MKKSILILILTAMLTSCVPTASVTLDPCRDEENCESSLNFAPFSENNTESESYAEIETQPLTECEVLTTETTVTTAKIQSETVCTTTYVTDVQKEKSQYDPTEVQKEETAEKPPEYNTEPSRSIPLENSRSNENPNCPPGSPGENTEVTEEYKEETEPPEYGMSDYEKALEVYNFMTANGSGTCVQYSWQTYEMCCQYGLECCFAWTENWTIVNNLDTKRRKEKRLK